MRIGTCCFSCTCAWAFSWHPSARGSPLHALLVTTSMRARAVDGALCRYMLACIGVHSAPAPLLVVTVCMCARSCVVEWGVFPLSPRLRLWRSRLL